jgi:hypothetical protein
MADVRCGPDNEGVEASALGLDEKDALRAATQRAINICKLYPEACATGANKNCLFKVGKVKVEDAAENKVKVTVSGICVCADREILPGDH